MGGIVTALVVQGDARRLPLPDASVDLIVTSPPYFALRSYTDAGTHYRGQIGSESTPAEYLDALWACTAEWIRVLKPKGSMFVNLGDKYSSGSSGDRNNGFNIRWGNAPGRRKQELSQVAARGVPGVQPKALLGIPWRYAIGCIDQLGLILRAELIWSKPNSLPESVTDRVRRSHEQWFHFVKQPRYYSAVDEIREAQVGGVVSSGHAKRGRGHGGDALTAGTFSKDGGFNAYSEQNGIAYNPLGKLPGSVWSIPSEPLQAPDKLGVDHFAAFPTEWPRRLILGWSPPGVCTVCGQGRRPVADADRRVLRRLNGEKSKADVPGKTVAGGYRGEVSYNITGYACACPEPTAPTRPALVLDPFGGTGTTALVAHALGRIGITVDMSGDYSRLARWRCTDRGELAKAVRVEKPKPVPEGQMEMFA